MSLAWMVDKREEVIDMRERPGVPRETLLVQVGDDHTF